jgi:hypothetical protein
VRQVIGFQDDEAMPTANDSGHSLSANNIEQTLKRGAAAMCADLQLCWQG